MKYAIWNINLKYFKFNLKYSIENEESYKVVITLNIMRVHTHTEYEANVNVSPYCASEVITLAVWCVAKRSKANADICMHMYKCVCSFYRDIIVWNTWVYSLFFFFFPLAIYPQHHSGKYMHQVTCMIAEQPLSWTQCNWFRSHLSHLPTTTTIPLVFDST